MPAPFLVVERLNVAYSTSQGGTLTALSDLSFTLTEGDFLQLTGASGAGKSTLLNVLAGIISLYSGFVSIGGLSPTDKRLLVAYVLQGYGLLPWKTVAENIMLPARLGHKQRPKDEQKALIELLGLDTMLRRYPLTLSGGQRQRVALARAFCQEASLLLLDEPFSALDLDKADEALQLLASLRTLYPITTVMATHHHISSEQIPHKQLHIPTL